MRLVVTFAALFGSAVLLQLGSGGVAPLDALAGLAAGFSAAEVGALGSAHFVGFLAGCWWAPRLMGSVGPSRAFAVFTALGTVGILGHTMVQGPVAWGLLRIMSGLCIAGSYTIIESWLQARLTNATRGRAMGVYRAIDITGALGAQLMIGVLDPASYVSYNLLALLCCAALLPLALTRLPPPRMPGTSRLRPAVAWRCSPLAAAAVVVSGLVTSAFRMVGPVYGVGIGLATDQLALFLAAFILGGALGQIPAGWIADRFDRRRVIIGFSAAGIAGCAATVALAGAGPWGAMAAAGFFGLVTFPLYSLAAAHAHDFATDEQRVELSAALMFLYAIGAIAAPYASAVLIGLYGPAAMFAFIAAAHVTLIAFGMARMGSRPTREHRTGYVYAPRTSFLVGRLLRRGRH
jgi:MFS family permease